MRAEYKYQVGEVVNETLKIVSQTRYGRKNGKAYEVQSLIYPDSPTYIVVEYSLANGAGCAYKCNRRIFEGNSLYSVKHIRPYLVDVEEAKKISKNHKKSIKVRCTECDFISNKLPQILTKKGFSCSKCSKGTSYPELFMLAYLGVKGIEYEYQKVFDNLSNRRFDFYLPKENIIIETHGLQHYQEVDTWNSYKITRKSDAEKKQYCEDNNITYVEIDARESTFDFIKKSVNADNILPMIKLTEENKILKELSDISMYPVKDIINLYEKGKSSIYISEKYNISKTAVLRLLKKHNVDRRMLEDYKNKKAPNKKKILCINTGEIFNSVTEAGIKFNISSIGNIVSVCKGKRNFTGKHPVTGERLRWEYVDNE